MTENEIKEEIKELHRKAKVFEDSEYATAGISSTFKKSARIIHDLLTEIQQYRAIGTVEELQKIKGVITDFPIDCGSPISNVEEIWNQLKKYLAIGTIEEFKALKEKSVAKKPIDKIMYLECPACGDVGILDYGYCSVCGQKLDWSE